MSLGADANQFGAWRAPMLAFARLHLSDRDDAEDAVQDALLAACSTKTGVDGEAGADPRPYLFGILKHKITDRLRQRYRQREREQSVDDELDSLLFDDRGHWAAHITVPRWHCPQERLQGAQIFRLVDACIHRLSPKVARVFSMKELMDCEPEAICDILSLSKSDYWQCMSRARKQLQLCLTEQGIQGAAP